MNDITIFIGSILFLEIIFIGAILFVLADALKKTGRGLKTVFVVAIILLLWLTGITIFNFTTEVFTKELLLAVVIPVILGVLLLLGKPYKEVIKAIPQAHYMKLQSLRILFGVLFFTRSIFLVFYQLGLETWLDLGILLLELQVHSHLFLLHDLA